LKDLLQFTDHGIYCPAADVFLDPWKPVKRALITHGHSDHAHAGHERYLCTDVAAPVIRHRLNLTDQVQTVAYGERLQINQVIFSFHPAGHIPGSAQVRVEHQGQVWVFTGDYKLEHDGLSTPFEPLRCHTLITESTFGLPVYQWQTQSDIFADINRWWRSNRSQGKTSVLAAYALGKAQRILVNVDHSLGPVWVHGAIDTVQRVLAAQGLRLPHTRLVTAQSTRTDWEGGLILCPPSALGSPWIKKFQPYSLAIASGWMSLRGTRRRRGADRGFALSDHADWCQLNEAVRASGASRVFVTHGYTEVFARWLQERGVEAYEARTQFDVEAET
jgi:putative mRNA 3-end processing factor